MEGNQRGCISHGNDSPPSATMRRFTRPSLDRKLTIIPATTTTEMKCGR